MLKNIIFIFTIIISSVVFAEPFLPSGLGESTEPSLPSGLFGNTENNKTNFENENDSPFVFNGFIEGRLGGRTQNQNYERDISIGEIRLQTDIEYEKKGITGKFVADFLYDGVVENTELDLENGDGFMDLREANLAFSPFDFMDVKIGRQILTWGLGDLIFINDFFPKDWNSFFNGRDEEYLKSPSDAFKMSLFSETINLDFVYTPRHDESRYIDGRRLSFFSPNLMRPSGENDAIVDGNERNDFFNEDEIAMRLYRNFGSAEVAIYHFNGYWGTPEGQNSSGEYFFPELQIWGASLRTPFGKGILSLEAGYYDSHEDKDGKNAFIRNSEARYLVGYEQELFSNFTTNLQYYTERMQDHGDYLANLPAGMPIKDNIREVWTLRFTHLMMQQKLILSLFNYYSPTDKDGYVRPKITYKATDSLMVEFGGNVFWGKEEILTTGVSEHTTFFGQFEDNSNVFAGIRYTF